MSNSNRNSNSNSNWRSTKIGATGLSRNYDPIRTMLADPKFWDAGLQSQGTERKQFVKTLHRAVDKLVLSKEQSVAMDADPELDEPALQYLAGLRHYYSELKPNEKVNVPCVRALLQKIMQNL